MGTILFFLVDIVERFICPWHISRAGMTVQKRPSRLY
jgi:hypothetical protein